jgi:hypothetical protein
MDVCVVIVAMVTDFCSYMIMFMNVCCYNRCLGSAVNGFWAL